MGKTILDLPEDLEVALARVASERGMSEAELIREALREKLLPTTTARPRVGLLAERLRDPTAAKSVDELLAGFGA